MASEVELCNLALSHIRGASINNLNEASVQAQNCKLKYPLLRDSLLSNAPWQFAHKVTTLALTQIESFNWAFTYQYPSDALRINRLVLNIQEIEQGGSPAVSRLFDPQLRELPNQQVKYEIRLAPEVNDPTKSVKVITANEKELRVDYRARVTDPNLFDSEFYMCLSHLLASELAVPVVGGKLGREFRSDEVALYQGYLNSAIESDLNEQYHPQQESEFVTVRN